MDVYKVRTTNMLVVSTPSGEPLAPGVGVGPVDDSDDGAVEGVLTAPRCCGPHVCRPRARLVCCHPPVADVSRRDRPPTPPPPPPTVTPTFALQMDRPRPRLLHPPLPPPLCQ